MKPFLWAILAAMTWGFAPILEKLGLMKIDAFVGLFYRSLGVVVGAILLGAFQLATIKTTWLDLSSNWIYLVGGGFLASIVGQIFFYNALKTGQASQVVPVAASYPLISFVLGVIFLGETVTLAKLTGLVLIILGVFFLK